MIEVRANLRLPADDGCLLATDVVLPAGDHPVPAIVTRTPYGRSGHLAEGLGWAARGFAFVVQDVRGRYDSEGTWRPYLAERADGAAVARWLVQQDWSDGRYVARGHSYGAYTAWAAALGGGPPACAVISLAPALGFDRVKFDPSGILRLTEHVAWWLDRAESRTDRDGLWSAMCGAQPDVLRHLPVLGLEQRLWADLPGWAQVVSAGPDARSPEEITDAELAELQIPTLHVGGWYDLLAGETLRMWTTTGSAHALRPTRGLLMGPWGHDLGAGGADSTSARHHGPASRVALGQREVAWLRSVLDQEIPAAKPPQDGVWVVGADRWMTTEAWPPPAAEQRCWQTGVGGWLGSSGARPRPGTDLFTYDPREPFPSLPPDADRAILDTRLDAVRYTTAPLAADLTIAGCPHVLLDASTDAVSTDWIVRILELDAAGRHLELARGSLDTARCGPAPHRIPLGSVAVEVPAGSRLRLEVTSSDFPLLARALGTGEDRYRGSTTRASRQQVHTGPGRTAVMLPVLDAR